MTTFPQTVLRLTVFSLLLVTTIAYTVEATTFSRLGRYTPLTVGVASSALLFVAVIREALRVREVSKSGARRYGASIEYSADEDQMSAKDIAASVRYVAWFMALVVGVYLLGLVVVGPVFVAAYLLMQAKRSLRFTLITVTAMPVVFWVFTATIGFRWPKGIWSLF